MSPPHPEDPRETSPPATAHWAKLGAEAPSSTCSYMELVLCQLGTNCQTARAWLLAPDPADLAHSTPQPQGQESVSIRQAAWGPGMGRWVPSQGARAAAHATGDPGPPWPSYHSSLPLLSSGHRTPTGKHPPPKGRQARGQVNWSLLKWAGHRMLQSLSC